MEMDNALRCEGLEEMTRKSLQFYGRNTKDSEEKNCGEMLQLLGDDLSGFDQNMGRNVTLGDLG